MQIPAWLKPGVWGAVIGVVVVAIIAFSADWIVTSGAAEEMAERRSEEAAIAALTPICVAQFKKQSDTQESEDLAALEEEGTSYSRSEYVEEQGWATLPGAEGPNDEVADACASELIKLAET